jgi:hypothetical protein
MLVDEEMDKQHKLDYSKPQQSVVAFLFGKSYKTHDVVLDLCREGYGEDASILLRSLFESAVNAGYLIKEDVENRSTMFLEHEEVTKYMLFKSNKELLLKSDTKTEGDYEEMRKNVQSLCLKYGPNFYNNWSCKRLEEMASEVGLDKPYLAMYPLYADIAHSRISSARTYISEDSSGLTIDTGPKDELISESLVSAFHYFFNIITVWNSVFELPLEEKLTKLQKEFNEYIDREYKLS